MCPAKSVTSSPLKGKFNSRAQAALAISGVIHDQRSLSQLLPRVTQNMDAVDRAFVQQICFGVCRHYFSLAATLDSCLDKPLRADDDIVKALLLTGIYQLTAMRTADHAAINETVEACSQLGKPRLKGLVNAILRRVSRGDYEIRESLESSQWNHPEWMIHKLRHNWPEQWQDILEANNAHPPMTLRVNPQHRTRDDYIAELSSAGISATACPFAKQGVVLDQAVNVQQLPGFESGHVSVQDSAAQLCVDLLQLQPEMKVLDACAAPGGKTAAMLEAVDGLQVVALDSDELRLERLQENLQRLKLSVEVQCAPAEKLSVWWDGVPFQRILVDAPCSASGVIRRHPDIKLLRQQEDIVKLAQQQLTLLSTLWQSLETGGLLVYATCSVFSQENSRIIERFLKTQADAELQTINIEAGFDTGFGRQLFPQPAGHDGFFYSCLRKIA